MTTWQRRGTATAFAALIACATVVVTPSPAAAVVGYIQCEGTTQITYTPGITLFSGPVHAAESNIFSPCTSSVPGIIAGENFQEYQADWNCNTLMHTGDPTYAIEWNDGSSSTLSVNYSVSTVGGQVVSAVHGWVVDGVLDGSTVVGTWTFAQPDLVQCATEEGMTEQLGTVVLTIGQA